MEAVPEITASALIREEDDSHKDDGPDQEISLCLWLP